MKGEIGRLRQVVCELVDKVSGGVGRVHSQREVVNCSTQTEAGVVTVCATSQTEQGVTGGKRDVCVEPGVSTHMKEVGCMVYGVGYRGKLRTAVYRSIPRYPRYTAEFRLRTAVLYRGIPRLDQNI